MDTNVETDVERDIDMYKDTVMDTDAGTLQIILIISFGHRATQKI